MQHKQATAEAPRPPLPAWRSPWVVGWLALVGVVVLVNIVMVTFAVRSSPGLVSENFYERGRDYATERAAREAAWPSGWQVRLDAPAPYPVGIPSPIRIAAVDDHGLPVEADRVQLFAYRPSDAAADFHLELVREAPGVYGGAVSFPLVGLWDLIVLMEAGEQRYDVARRIRVQGE